MAEFEPKIGLIGEDGQAKEIIPTGKPGADNQMATIRSALAAGLEAGLFEISPFILTQPEAPSTDQDEVTAGPTTPFIQSNREQTLELAAVHYKEKLQDPQRLHDFYQAHWDYHGIELMGLSQKDTRVTDVPYGEDDIYQFMKLGDPQSGNPGVDLPYFHLPVLASSDARVLIGKGFSNLGAVWAFQQGYEVINGHQIAGWMRVDASLDAPYRENKKGEITRLNVDELKAAIKADNRVGQTISIYGPSGNVIKHIFDYYPDQGTTWSRLPESLKDGRVLDAYFFPYGIFSADSDWDRRARHPRVGGRSFLGA